MNKNTINLNTLPELAIRMNRIIGELCPVCTEATNANIGLEIVEETTKKPVCQNCAIEYAVDLAYLLSLADAARLLAISEQDFGVKVERGMSWAEFNNRDNVIPFRRKEVARV